MALCSGTHYPGAMKPKEKIENIFPKGLPVAIMLLRIVVAWRLWAGTWPYVRALKPIGEIVEFFTVLQIPLPAISAYISLYVQFLSSVFIFIGWQTRVTAFLMTINFSVALLAAHLHDPIEKSFQAWALWAIAIFFLCNGAGKFSLDQIEKKRIRS